MTENPALLIDLQKITENTRVIVQKCALHNIDVVAVTKAVCGDPGVGRAMLEGGAVALADARIMNIRRLRQAGIREPVMLLRSPMISEIEDVVKYSSMSLNSEPEVMARLSECPLDHGIRHEVIIMIDVGEIREGILPADIFKVGEQVKKLKGIRIIGAGTNLACYSGVRPTTEKVGTPVTGGLNYREAHLALELIAEIKMLRSLEICEVNPIMDNGGTGLPGWRLSCNICSGQTDFLLTGSLKAKKGNN